MIELIATKARPKIPFLEAVVLMEKSVTVNSPLYGTVISTELLKNISCEHCSKVEDLRLKSVNVQHVNPMDSMDVHALLSLVEQDGTSCLQCAKIIHEKTRHLLNEPQNAESRCNTVFHHAARCHKIRTLFHLICLVAKEGGNELVSRVLRKLNNQGETPLHQAVKSGNVNMVELLLWVDPELVGIFEGTSALYAAVSMGHRHRLIARTLQNWGTTLSFDGPEGKHILHAAVLFDKDNLSNILYWDTSLVQKTDENGNTPLHLAALTPYHPFSDRFLLRECKEVVFISNANGLFLVHLSSSSDQIEMTKLLIAQCPKCIFVRDRAGRTMIHFAVLNRSHKTVSHVLENWKSFADIVNLQDGDGNTALHLAIEVGDLSIVSTLLSIPMLNVDIQNKQEKTALDLAVIKCEKLGNFYWEEHSDAYIKNSLQLIGANRSSYPSNYLQLTCIPGPLKLEDKTQSEQLIACSEKMAITSVLIASGTFAASFTLPGEASDEERACGMFKLAKGPLFSALAMSNWMGFICSVVATLCAMLAAMPIMELKCRRFYVKFAHFYTKSSLTALVTTISLLGSVTFGPQSKQTAVLIWLGNPAAFLFVNAHLLKALYISAKPLIARQGLLGKLKFGLSTMGRILLELWPTVVAGIWLAGSFYAAGRVWRVCPDEARPPVSGGPK